MSEEDREFPPELRMYGYCVAWRDRKDTSQRDPSKLPPWQIEQDDQYLNLPAHYLILGEAIDRARYIRERGLDARVCALVAEHTDTREEFDNNDITKN